ncbi:MAG: VWA domain-containing protein [Planctomycetes bacterium]|nr:VWA domain-containing protein [Planctomycetota bacterium]
MRSRIFAAAIAVAVLISPSIGRAAPAPAPAPAEVTGKHIDVAICLDTSGSMNGLIESAKLKLWTIVNDLAKIQPTPVLRVSVYQYGHDSLNANDGWVRKELDLTNDLDEVYKKLNAFRTGGGTELVARVTQSALNDLKWSEDKDALRLIFVCGNEPADQDKQVTLASVAEIAKKKGVFVNTIYCGRAAHPESNLWKDFATMAGGSYSNIDQNAAQTQVVIKTPQDEELLKLSTQMNATYVVYGGKNGDARKENQAAQDSNAAKASPAVAIDRTVTKNSALYRCDTWDLVDRMKNDAKFDIKSLKEEELSDELKKLKPEERVEFVKKKAAERDALRKKIDDLTAKRATYIQEEMKKQPKSEKDKSFDEALRSTIRTQAATKGIKIPE